MTPTAGESVTEGTILEWHKQPGDPVRADETVVEISTDKVDVELPAPASGTLTEVLAPAGETVTVDLSRARFQARGVQLEGPITPTRGRLLRFISVPGIRPGFWECYHTCKPLT